MAITHVNVGTLVRADSGNVTPGLPASILAGDILVLVIGSADNVSVSLPAAYTKKIEVNAGTNCRLTVAWARATGSDSAPLVTHTAGSSVFARIAAYRGCKSAGDPFTDAQSQVNTAITTTVTAPTITPLSGDFVIFAVAVGEGGTSNGGTQSLSGWSGANPTLTERADNADPGTGTLLCDGGFADGSSTGGATGSRTVTLATTAEVTANAVGALLALTQDTGGPSAGPAASFALPLSGIRIPGYPALAPPIGLTQGPDPSTFDVVSPIPATRFFNPLSLALGLKLPFAPQPITTPATAATYFGVVQVNLVDTVTTAGTRTTFSVSTASLTDTVTTAGIRKTFGTSTTAEVVTITTAGTRKTFGSSTTSETVTITTLGTRKTFGTSTVSETVAITTNGVRTRFGSSTVTETVAVTTAGTRIATGVSTVGLTVAITTIGKLGAFSSSIVIETVTITTAGTGGTPAGALLAEDFTPLFIVL